MKPETKKLQRAYYFIIQQILNRYSTNKTKDKKILNEAFKSHYRRFYNVNHKSLKDFTKDDLRKLIDQILIQFSVEYGVYLLQPNDPINAEDISLSEYLEYKNWDMSDPIDSMIEGFSALPEGFVLINSLNSLKRLKKGKRVWKDGNIEYRFGDIVYVYSHREGLYYKKMFSTFTPITKLNEYINLKIIYTHE